MKKDILYRKYYDMKRRCLNPKSPNYKYYGAIGITVCDEWINSYESFVRDMGIPKRNNLQIDRIDNSKGYFKENCRWVTAKTNMRNTRRASKVYVYRDKKYVGTYKSVAECAEKLNIDGSHIYHCFAKKRKTVKGYTIYKQRNALNEMAESLN